MIGSVAKHKYFPAALGIGSLVVFVALLELLIRVGIINRFMVEVERSGVADTILRFPLQNALTRPIRNAAARQGRAEFLSLWAGQALRLARRQPAADLVARLAAEAISATEDLGALAWAIANRTQSGVVDAYLSYPVGSVREPFRRFKAGDSLVDVLQVPNLDDVGLLVTPEDAAVYAKAVPSLEVVLKVAASNYLRQNPDLVKTYNKVKHGFVVVVRMDALIPGREPTTDWRNDVNVLSGIDHNGNISFTAIERYVDQMEQLMKMIKMCGDA